jgi:hypothetical protein
MCVMLPTVGGKKRRFLVARMAMVLASMACIQASCDSASVQLTRSIGLFHPLPGGAHSAWLSIMAALKGNGLGGSAYRFLTE